MSKHTPGPWLTIKYPDVKSHTVYGNNDRSHSLATVKGPNAGADAQLIAAAPELLEACEAALAAYDGANQMGRSTWSGEDVDAMRTAVAKATGESCVA